MTERCYFSVDIGQLDYVTKLLGTNRVDYSLYFPDNGKSQNEQSPVKTTDLPGRGIAHPSPSENSRRLKNDLLGTSLGRSRSDGEPLVSVKCGQKAQAVAHEIIYDVVPNVQTVHSIVNVNHKKELQTAVLWSLKSKSAKEDQNFGTTRNKKLDNDQPKMNQNELRHVHHPVLENAEPIVCSTFVNSENNQHNDDQRNEVVSSTSKSNDANILGRTSLQTPIQVQIGHNVPDSEPKKSLDLNLTSTASIKQCENSASTREMNDESGDNAIDVEHMTEDIQKTVDSSQTVPISKDLAFSGDSRKRPSENEPNQFQDCPVEKRMLAGPHRNFTGGQCQSSEPQSVPNLSFHSQGPSPAELSQLNKELKSVPLETLNLILSPHFDYLSASEKLSILRQLPYAVFHLNSRVNGSTLPATIDVMQNYTLPNSKELASTHIVQQQQRLNIIQSGSDITSVNLVMDEKNASGTNSSSQHGQFMVSSLPAALENSSQIREIVTRAIMSNSVGEKQPRRDVAQTSVTPTILNPAHSPVYANGQTQNFWSYQMLLQAAIGKEQILQHSSTSLRESVSALQSIREPVPVSQLSTSLPAPSHQQAAIEQSTTSSLSMKQITANTVPLSVFDRDGFKDRVYEEHMLRRAQMSGQAPRVFHPYNRPDLSQFPGVAASLEQQRLKSLANREPSHKSNSKSKSRRDEKAFETPYERQKRTSGQSANHKEVQRGLKVSTQTGNPHSSHIDAPHNVDSRVHPLMTPQQYNRMQETNRANFISHRQRIEQLLPGRAPQQFPQTQISTRINEFRPPAPVVLSSGQNRQEHAIQRITSHYNSQIMTEEQQEQYNRYQQDKQLGIINVRPNQLVRSISTFANQPSERSEKGAHQSNQSAHNVSNQPGSSPIQAGPVPNMTETPSLPIPLKVPKQEIEDIIEQPTVTNGEKVYAELQPPRKTNAKETKGNVIAVITLDDSDNEDAVVGNEPSNIPFGSDQSDPTKRNEIYEVSTSQNSSGRRIQVQEKLEETIRRSARTRESTDTVGNDKSIEPQEEVSSQLQREQPFSPNTNRRVYWTEQQRIYLNSIYSRNRKPDDEYLAEIAQRLGAESENVAGFFYNKRTRANAAKKQQKCFNGSSQSS